MNRSSSVYARRIKRPLDVLLGVGALTALLPLLTLVALGVLLSSGWPLFYRSERFGRGGTRFLMWKFRTMMRDADGALQRWRTSHPALADEYGRNFKLVADPRVTAVGRFLRRSSLDELPNLFNVLRGEMSLVGPRPYLPTLAPEPGLVERVLSVRPGMTGPWQVQGRNALPPQRRMQLDAEYAATVSFTRDAANLLRTLKPLIKMDGA